MIKNKKKTGKMMSLLSALVAVVMLATTAFASCGLTDMAMDDYRIEVQFNESAIDFLNIPFIDNGEVYVPLRETYEKIGVMNSPESAILLDNGIIDIKTAEIRKNTDLSNEAKPVTFISKHRIEIGVPKIIMNGRPTLPGEAIRYEYEMKNAPIMKNDITYVPYEALHYLLSGTSYAAIGYKVYDKNDIIIDEQSQNIGWKEPLENQQMTIRTQPQPNTSPNYTVIQFFYLFAQSDFENMKRYCTEKCIKNYFGDGYVFGMVKAEILKIGMTVACERPNTDTMITVTVKMTPHKDSVYTSNAKETTYNLYLAKYVNGKYYIHEFGR